MIYRGAGIAGAETGVGFAGEVLALRP